MKLSKLYTNRPDRFKPIFFKDGLNIIYGEIRLPENKNKDTHNLGKSTLGRIIDFTLLSKRDNHFFMFRHKNIFNDFTFFIEIELNANSYLTIRRSVENATKISFKKHSECHQDLLGVNDEQWDHLDIAFDKAKELLDSLLDLSEIRPWTYRDAIGYLIRAQDDYNDVFKLKKYASRDVFWKPYLARILGFNSVLIKEHYQSEDELDKQQEKEKTIKQEMGGSIEDISKVEGILLLKQQEIEKKQSHLDAFDFSQQDKEKTTLLIDKIDEKIAELNKKRYSLQFNRKKIIKSLQEDKILFNPDEAALVFREAGILFSGQIKKDYEQLIAFNRAITEERIGYLTSEKSEIDAEISNINSELASLGKKRSETLSFLSDTEIFNKYKSLSNELISLRSDIEFLEKQKVYLQKLQGLRDEIRCLTKECNDLQSKVEHNVEAVNADNSSLFSKIRLYFSEIVDHVINRKALLDVSVNKKGHLEFKAEILDDSGNSTSADMGHTYRKLLCIAFDMTILRAHLNDNFPHFVFHDGVLESLDNRKKENLLEIIRQYSEIGIQSIITLIDSDLPSRGTINESEIILKLHDEGEQGRLFKMNTW